jgi:hypothetical protein
MSQITGNVSQLVGSLGSFYEIKLWACRVWCLWHLAGQEQEEIVIGVLKENEAHRGAHTM